MWSGLEWISKVPDHAIAEARLTDAGYAVMGWMSGKPVLRTEPDDWETVEQIALGELTLDDLADVPEVPPSADETQGSALPKPKPKRVRKTKGDA